jgi:hypothetical protein
MDPLIHPKKLTLLLLIAVTFVLLPRAHALVPAPDGCYPNYTTAEGCNALTFLTGGAGNTGVGWYALYSDSTGSFNTGVGGGALALNNGDSNTAIGAAALLLNTSGAENTAVGTDALVFNDTGEKNTANGVFALFSNTTGSFNTAVGSQALQGNLNGGSNTAAGFNALNSNISGGQNTAAGFAALFSNTTGDLNTACGADALTSNTVGAHNTAVGYNALFNNTAGSFNIAIGDLAGNIITGDDNIAIGNGGNPGESETIRIGQLQTRTFMAGIRGVTTGISNAVPVLIDSAGQLGTMSSSRRFKKEISPMGEASEAILALKPVTFHYKSDSTDTPQFGLIAEEVADVNSDLVVRDADGQIYTVRYDAVNAMLLNEFLKEHRKVEDLRRDFQATVAQQQKQIEALSAGLRKVSAQLVAASPSGGGLEANGPARRVVNNP